MATHTKPMGLMKPACKSAALLTLLLRAADTSVLANPPPGAAQPAQAQARTLNLMLPAAAGSRMHTSDLLLPFREDIPVTPQWSLVRNTVAAGFQPGAAAITEGGSPHAVLRQVTHAAPEAAPVDRKTGPLLAAGANQGSRPGVPHLDELLDAAQEAHERPLQRVTEILAIVDREGRRAAVVVASSSGSLRFDDAAREAVERALDTHPAPDGRGRVLTRWRIAASHQVPLPRLRSQVGPNHRVTGVTPQMAFRFDESRGKVEPLVPFSDRIATSVELVSLQLDRQPSGGPAAAPASP